ncbi:MAG: 5-methylcytosine-specific restriction endonuclease system specificity protein McrC [Oscillospiraceae bacterium]|nr:5-methylcytosine-specific restriction endonuclease system specificity protein McrC [Oscillospiraceae bacterium]
MIPIRNIYYMLSYAFQVLNEQGYKSVETEQFGNVADMCAAILIKGVSLQLKRGLGREYIEKTESLSTLHGRIEISESIKTYSMLKRQLICSYDDFSENSYMNRIIKSTMELLLHSDINKTRKKEIRKLLVFFKDVELLDIKNINWKVNYNRNNQSYRMLISICFLVVKGLLQTNTDGTTRLMDFIDEQRMSRLYEKFILEYYRKEYPQLSANASQIPWALDNENGDMLPIMRSDVMLSYGGKTLIVDAKYYSHSTQVQYDTHTLHSGNLYQIFTYVKNKKAQLSDDNHKVAGMLLYAKTDDMVEPSGSYQMSGNRISVRTLDLDKDFSEIANQLNSIADESFGNDDVANW